MVCSNKLFELDQLQRQRLLHPPHQHRQISRCHEPIQIRPTHESRFNIHLFFSLYNNIMSASVRAIMVDFRAGWLQIIKSVERLFVCVPFDLVQINLTYITVAFATDAVKLPDMPCEMASAEQPMIL